MSDLREPLLAWYDEHARDLPWREPSASPWAVLVSEFMLQQTPVARVLPVYERWLDRWPTPADLAADPTGEAVRAWGRLGLPAPGAAAARRGDRDRRASTAARCRRDYDDLIALPGRRRLHGGRGRVVRVPPPARRARHQRPAGAGPDGRAAWSSRPPPSPGPSVTWPPSLLPEDGPTAAAWAVATMELGATVCVAAAPAVRGLPGRRPVRVAGGRLPGVRRTAPQGPDLRRHRPPVPRPAARRAPGQRRSGAPQPARRRRGRWPSSASGACAGSSTTAWSAQVADERLRAALSVGRGDARRSRRRGRRTACSCTRVAGVERQVELEAHQRRVQQRHRTPGPLPRRARRRPGGRRPPRPTPRWPRAPRARRARARTARGRPPRRTSAGSAPAAGS